MQKLVFTNGGGQTIDLTSGNFGITNWEGLSDVGLNIQTQQVPFQDGGVFLDALMEQREISVTVAIQDNNDLSARYELKRQLISALNPKLGEGVLVYTNDYLSRQIKAVPQLPIFENKNSNDAGTLKASVVFSCPSPYWEDLEETSRLLEVGEVAEINNEGDIPAQVKLEYFTNGSVNPQIQNLTTKKRIEYNGTLNKTLYVDTNIGHKKAVTKDLYFNKIINYNANVSSVCYAKNQSIFVGVGDNKVHISYDGILWTENVVPYNDLMAVTYSEEKKLFVIVTEGGQILTSTDLENWTQEELPEPALLFGVKYSETLHLFIVVGSSGVLWTSSDGHDWTVRTSGTSEQLNSIACSNSTIVVVGTNGTVLSSSNGTTWSSGTTGISDDLWGVAYSGSSFVAVGSNGIIIKSSNGDIWSTSTSGVSVYLSGVTYSETKAFFVAVGENGTIIKSSDGESWMSATSGISSYLSDVVYSNELRLFVVTGAEGTLLTSQDGTQWTDRASDINTDLHGTTYAEDLDLCVSVGDGGMIVKSQDGENWEIVSSGVSTDLQSVKYISSLHLFIVVGKMGTILTSQDGENWEIVSSGTVKDLYGVTYSEERQLFVVVGDDSIVLTSTDGTTWTVGELGTYSNSKSVVYSEEKHLFVVVGSSDVIFTSPNGTTWTSVEFSQNIALYSVIYSKELGQFMAVGEKSRLYVSADGSTWEMSGYISGSRTLKDIVYANNLKMFVIVAQQGYIYASLDGKTWIDKDSGLTTDLYSIIYSVKHDKFVFVGWAGTIMNSTYSEEQNQIQNISLDSDMNFNLPIGESQVRVLRDSGNVSTRITYRQKYIGV